MKTNKPKVIQDWAPQSLCDLYSTKYDEENPSNESQNKKILHQVNKNLITIASEEKEVLYRLITNEKMEQVWKMLNKKKRPTAPEPYDMPLMLYKHTIDSIKFSIKTHHSVTDKENQYSTIAKAAKNLSIAVKNTEFDLYPLDWVSEKSLTEIKDSNKTKGNKINLAPKYPRISIALEKLATDAKNTAKETKTKINLVKKPKSITKETLFARSIYESFWRNEFKGPLYQTLANYCSVALNEDIDKEKTKDMLKNSNKVASHFNMDN